MMKLNNWGVVSLNPSPRTPPEAQVKGLIGNVEGSEKFEDGCHITTSVLVKVERKEGQLVATTRSGSEYNLGMIAEDYEQQFPDAMERFLKTWGLS